MDEEFFLAEGFVADGGFVVGVDVATMEDQLAVFDAGERFAELASAPAEGFDLAAEQDQAAFDLGGDEIVVQSAAVGDAGGEILRGLVFHPRAPLSKPETRDQNDESNQKPESPNEIPFGIRSFGPDSSFWFRNSGFRIAALFYRLDWEYGAHKILGLSLRLWRNWQTRKIQVLVSKRRGGSTPLSRIAPSDGGDYRLTSARDEQA
jgi:hypothetical protein